MILDTIELRGFEPLSAALTLRTVGGCYQMCHRPDDRALIGVGLFTVTPHERGYRFDTRTRLLGHGEMPPVIIDWLQDHLPTSGAIISWDSWRSVPQRLAALADPARHPSIVAAVADTDGRWRDLPRSMTWHLKQAQVATIPCLCGPAPHPACEPELPSALLPDPADTGRTLMREAASGWVAWASMFGAFDDHEHPARRAIAAFRTHVAGLRENR